MDDYPTGGGAGLIIQCQPVIDAINSVKTPQSKVYLLSASGKKIYTKYGKAIIFGITHYFNLWAL